jgi:hypothetical protein
MWLPLSTDSQYYRHWKRGLLHRAVFAALRGHHMNCGSEYVSTIRLMTALFCVLLRLPSVGMAQDIVTSVSTPVELARLIDQQLEAGFGGDVSGGLCTDAEFVRRIYLDFAGRIPTVVELRLFLADTVEDRRVRLVERLLSEPAWGQRMADVFHVMLMERRGEHAEWQAWLRNSFAENKRWDVLVREILDPDAAQEQLRGAAFFQTRRLEKVGQQETDYAGLTRDIGRLFLGCDLQCAQCHDHLSIDSYRQVDFQGLYTVYQNAVIRTDVQYPAVVEKVLTKKTDYMSVFEKTPQSVGPRIPFGIEQEIPQFEKGQEYAVAPDRSKNFPGIPRFRGMQVIAADVTARGNRRFAENAANRIWFLMLGTGLVNPLDQLHDDNPATHPEILKTLSDFLVATDFDLKLLMHGIALSRVYQRTTAGAAEERHRYQFGLERRLSAEQLLESMLTACGSSVAGSSVAGGAVESPERRATREAFIKAFGNVPQDPELEFAPSLKSALFVMNDPLVQGLLQPGGGNLSERLAGISEPAAVAEELYLSVLSRFPDDGERAFVAEYLLQQSDRQQAVVNLIWSLLASTEFCLNH